MTKHDNGNSTSYKRSYSLADIARKLNRPRTTVQAWRDQFKAYLPTISGTKGRATRYEVEALTLFELIAKMKDDNEPPEMIEKTLKQNVNFITVDEEDEEDEAPFMLQMADSFKHLEQLTRQNAVILAALNEQRQKNDELTNELREIKMQQAENQIVLAQSHVELREELTKELTEKITAELSQQLTEQDERTTKRDEEKDRRAAERDEKLMNTMRAIQETKKEVAASSESKSIWSKFFGN
ncbi:DUF3967 domain-containing protein [Sutcliffiella horikoshii]|uniref:DUF3967 domain-containing protein n=1 Tax=Sutcliffiella horikoshii TaxID=79883 RepID=UPI00384E003B